MNQNHFDPENMLKGRMAETLVEDLLKQSGNAVYRFGYEAILQNLTQIQQNFDRNSDIGQRICSIPDFVVIDINNNPILLEVKFRWDGNIFGDDKKKFERISDFWNAKIIIVNRMEKPYFRISTAPYLDKEGMLMCKPLIEETCWKIDGDIYNKFETLVEKYLKLPLVSEKT
jgi:hypothetical protein